MILPGIAATIINSVMIIAYYASELFPGSSGVAENLGIMFAGNHTPEMLAQEHAYYSKQAAENEGKEDEVSHGWSLWSKLQLLVVIVFLVFFACGFDVCVVSICAGAILMVIASYKRQHYDLKPIMVQYDEDGNPLPPKKTYDMDGNEIEQEEEELVTESETTLTEVDYGLLMLFTGQFLLIGSFNDTGLPQGFFNLTMGGSADKMTKGACMNCCFVAIVTLLLNVASNLPVVQMLAATFPFASPSYEWLQMSLSATINMIAAFQDTTVGAPFGIPSCLACLYVGTFLLATFYFSPDGQPSIGSLLTSWIVPTPLITVSTL
jgi:hypothetical protein